jgi:hypothetical protein
VLVRCDPRITLLYDRALRKEPTATSGPDGRVSSRCPGLEQDDEGENAQQHKRDDARPHGGHQV